MKEKIIIMLITFGLSIGFILLKAERAAAQGGKIAFISERDGNPQIYLMNSDGTTQTRLTNNSHSDHAPAISSDGSKIAFMSNRDGNLEIYVMNSDGTNQMRLTNNSVFDSSPTFSPDGSKIAFESHQDGNSEIYVMNSDGTNQTRLTNNSAVDRSPAFSSDGSKIAFVSYEGLGINQIYVMNSDGTNQTLLTNTEYNKFEPEFSPDGSKIAFQSCLGVSCEIYVINVNGTNETQLTNSPIHEFSPTFSPDGSKIAFFTIGGGYSVIYVMNSDGTNQTPLTSNLNHNYSPSWSRQVAPNLSNIAVTTPISENGTAVLSGSISDLNANDNFTLTVNWGDGSPAQTFNYPAGTTSFVETHQYLDDNPTATSSDNYTINLTLSDNHAESDTGSIVVTVNNVAPTLSNISVNPSIINVGGTVALSGIVGDVGAQDSHTVIINWGDGSPNTTLNLPAAGVAAFNATHQYTHTGNYTIHITASDDDSGVTNESVSITVNTTALPNAPSNLAATEVSASQINLVWTDNSNNEDGFAIEGCRNKSCTNFVQIAQVNANVTNFSDTGLFSNTFYHYRVRAFNRIGNSGFSNTASAKTLRR